MDTGNYQYSQYESTAEYDSRVNSSSSAQQPADSMMSQQSGMVSQQPGMMSQQSGMISQQSGMMPQPSGMMPQQSGMMPPQYGLTQPSGMMPQLSGMMSQQSGMWGMPQQSDSRMYQQPQNSWMPPMSGAMMTQPSSGSMSKQGSSFNMSQQSNSYSMSQQSGNFGSSSTPSNYSAPMQNFQNQSGMPYCGNMPDQSNFSTGSSSQQQGGNSASYNMQGSSYQGGNSTSGFQQGNNNRVYQQGGNSMFKEGINTPYQQGGQNSANNYQQGKQNPSYQQGNQNSEYQQSNQRAAYQQGNQNSSYGQGNSNFYQQGGGAAMNQQNNTNSVYQQGDRNFMNQQERRPPGYPPRTAGMNDQLDEFYASIDKNTDGTPRHDLYNTSNVHQAGQLPSSTLHSSGFQHTTGSHPHGMGSQMGTGPSGFSKGNMSQTLSKSGIGRPSATREPDSSSTRYMNATRKPSDQFVDEDTEYCKLCNVYFTSAPMYAFHVRGIAHTQRMVAVNAGKNRNPAETPYIVSGRNFTQTVPQDNIPRVVAKNEQKTTDNAGTGGATDNAGTGGANYCELCDIHLNHERMLWRHFSGKRHQKALKAVEEGRAPPVKKTVQHGVDPNIEKAALLLQTHVPEEEMSILNFSFGPVPPDEPIVGLGFLVETVSNNESVYECELCGTTSNLFNMVQHVIGLKHRVHYLKVRDPEHFETISKSLKKAEQSELARKLCMELENIEGRGVARYVGPAREVQEEPRQEPDEEVAPEPTRRRYRRDRYCDGSGPEKLLAVETLKRTLLEDFHRRNIDPETATKMLDSRMKLLSKYENSGIPFTVARERVIEEEERCNLLLEFERQSLTFEEAETRIDHRLKLVRAHEENGCPTEEARSIVLDEEVICDFKHEFVQMGLHRGQAQKMAEKRLWMLQHLHFQGLSPEAASERIILIEQGFESCIRHIFDDDGQRRGRRESETAEWQQAREDLEKYVAQSCEELCLTAEQTEAQVSIALESFDKYKGRRLSAEEAKGRVLLDDLPIPSEHIKKSHSDTKKSEPKKDPGCSADIIKRVHRFESKLNSDREKTAGSESNKKTEKEESQVVDPEKQLADFDKRSRIEIQNLLSDMRKAKVPADEARSRFEALYKQLENLRENLLSAKKPAETCDKTLKANSVEESSALEHKQASEDGQSSKETQVSKENLSKKEQSMTEEISSPKEVSRKGQSMKQESSGRVKLKTDPSKVGLEQDKGKLSEEAVPKESSTNKHELKNLDRNNAKKASETSHGKKKDTGSDDRWNASLKIFLQKYGLDKDESLSQTSKKDDKGQERYSPSDLSPRHSKSRSRERSGRGRRKSRSPYSREVGRGERRESGSLKWGTGLRRSRSRSRLSNEHRRRSISPGHRNRPPSGDREVGRRSSPGYRSSGDLGRRSSPGHRSPGRRSPGRRSPFSLRDPQYRRSPFNRRSPRRRSPRHRSPLQWHQNSLERQQSPSMRSHRIGHPSSRERRFSPPREDHDFISSERHRMHEPIRDRRRSRDGRYRSPIREQEFSYEDGVWPDVDDPWD